MDNHRSGQEWRRNNSANGFRFYITEVGITEVGTPVARRRAGIAVGARDRQPVDTHGGKRERTR